MEKETAVSLKCMENVICSCFTIKFKLLEDNQTFHNNCNDAGWHSTQYWNNGVGAQIEATSTGHTYKCVAICPCAWLFSLVYNCMLCSFVHRPTLAPLLRGHLWRETFGSGRLVYVYSIALFQTHFPSGHFVMARGILWKGLGNRSYLLCIDY